METPSAGQIVTVPYPYSDLSRTKLRPAVVLAAIQWNDFVLCQVTSNPKADSTAIRITDADFVKGTLERVSYVRPGKLFTGHRSVMQVLEAHLTQPSFERIVESIVGLLRGVTKRGRTPFPSEHE